MKTSEKILQYIGSQGETSAKQLIDHFNLSERAIFKQLSKLIESGELTKIGKSPKVFYKLGSLKLNKEVENLQIEDEIREFIETNFLYITPLGEYFSGIEGFKIWCRERKLDVIKQANQYFEISTKINKSKKNGVIIATDKFKTSFEKIFLKEVFYVDFYSIPQFGKTKLGQLLLYAKQSQDRLRIKNILQIVYQSIGRVIRIYNIDAIGFIPPTVKREVQFMKEFERNLNFNLPTLKISKIKTDVIIPQKTLNKLSDRILNAQNTIIVEERRNFKNILLIDDAVGSGATLNETAKKIINNGVGENVFGLGLAGSYKGFDVISEV